MTEHDIRRLFPHASASLFKANKAGPERAPATNPEPVKRRPLVSVPQGEGESRVRPAGRVRIVFTIYSRRPADYDGYHIKEIQDLLVKAEVLYGDEWDILSGEVVSEKVHSEGEERTEIQIFQP